MRIDVSRQFNPGLGRGVERGASRDVSRTARPVPSTRDQIATERHLRRVGQLAQTPSGGRVVPHVGVLTRYHLDGSDAPIEATSGVCGAGKNAALVWPYDTACSASAPERSADNDKAAPGSFEAALMRRDRPIEPGTLGVRLDLFA